MMMWNPERLWIARRRRGYTATRLAELCSVTLQTIARYEKGETVPDERMVQMFAEQLRFPLGYFFRSDPPVVEPHQPSFRALQSMTARERDQSLSLASLAIELEQELARRFELPTPNVPDLSEWTPECAADMLRVEWRMGIRPVPHMIQRVESHGVCVFSLHEDVKKADAFCLWAEGIPFLFLSAHPTVERARFNCAHELGHLVLHRHGGHRGKEAEKEANRFASAFLMPRESVLASCSRGMVLEQIIEQKKRWGVAASALAYRLHSPEIGLLSDWQYKRIMMELSRRGRELEPEPIERRETSWRISEIFRGLSAERVLPMHLAKQLEHPVEDLEAITFNLGLTVLQGGNEAFSRKTLYPPCSSQAGKVPTLRCIPQEN